MHLIAIFHCWDDFDLLDYSVENILPCVDEVVVIASNRSNYGEVSLIPKEWLDIGMGNRGINLWVQEPRFNIPLHSETDKRNYGIQIARARGATHFITMDADEFYKHDEFLKAKEMFHVNHSLQGLVCPLTCYFGSPQLSLGRDVTLVPHIHKMTPTIRHDFNRKYPFAWSGKQIRIDPSRSLNINSGVEYTEIVECHHYSWLRKDYQKKIRNSTARKNLEQSNILQQLLQPKEGDYIDFYRKHLTRSTVDFGIDEKLFIQSL